MAATASRLARRFGRKVDEILVHDAAHPVARAVDPLDLRKEPRFEHGTDQRLIDHRGRAAALGDHQLAASHCLCFPVGHSSSAISAPSRAGLSPRWRSAIACHLRQPDGREQIMPPDPSLPHFRKTGNTRYPISRRANTGTFTTSRTKAKRPRRQACRRVPKPAGASSRSRRRPMSRRSRTSATDDAASQRLGRSPTRCRRSRMA